MKYNKKMGGMSGNGMEAGEGKEDMDDMDDMYYSPPVSPYDDPINRGVTGQNLNHKEMKYDPATGMPYPCMEVNLDMKEYE